MRSMKHLLYRIITTPPHKLCRMAIYKAKSAGHATMLKWHDKHFPTYEERFTTGDVCVPLFSEFSFDYSSIDEQKASMLGDMYMQHRFDLLGTGWVRCGYIDNAPGFSDHKFHALVLEADEKGNFLKSVVNEANIPNAKKIWKMVSKDYIPIDWQKDYKSGYRWSAHNWYRPQCNASKRGGDIKIPWELSRFQHLPRLAILSAKFPKDASRFRDEFINELADFYAANPPRMGVNYMCTMDVGIRIANVALAYTLFYNQGIQFTADENLLLTNFVYNHCKHIRNNLEWSAALTSNHYFADIAGLLFGSAILPECPEKRQWIEFAATEIQQEIIKQFHEEGTNEEGSTAYHRLTAEMAIYSLALMHRLAKQGYCQLPARELLTRLGKAGVFISHITKSDGSFTQIGDNDSGLFFRLSITGRLLSATAAKDTYVNLQNYHLEKANELYLDENMNDGRTFCSSVYGLTGLKALQRHALTYPLEAAIIHAIAGESLIIEEVKPSSIMTIGSEDVDLPFTEEKRFDIPKVSLITGLHQVAYQEFGIYIYKSDALYLCINATKNGQKGNAGHAHNDKLSIELVVAEENYCLDPGTYVYTADPDVRNKYRSVTAHNSIQAGIEQNEYLSLFSMKDTTRCRCLQWDSHMAQFEVKYKNVTHRRKVSITDHAIIINDYSNVPFTVQWEEQPPITAGYGKLKS